MSTSSLHWFTSILRIQLLVQRLSADPKDSRNLGFGKASVDQRFDDQPLDLLVQLMEINMKILRQKGSVWHRSLFHQAAGLILPPAAAQDITGRVVSFKGVIPESRAFDLPYITLPWMRRQLIREYLVKVNIFHADPLKLGQMIFEQQQNIVLSLTQRRNVQLKGIQAESQVSAGNSRCRRAPHTVLLAA